ncbi:PAAR domain-containing protein [Paracoccus sulfuroxidans]|uniref:Putative Zn-binding protein involved in type VI secretion n=1 Tax=Paracoccus sulfuroxidans TaxID=384678 RepID=A0A562NQ84_9RHOB|nr:PAAR domain-containing protein [Paracoccus sulfuroxidans]TWI33876.1 putative Zn-binding protein involved in type VI secretion [Paracoccus sulfuroxidans]
MKPIARLGDKHDCPIHGVNAIVKVASRSSCDARPVATVGDLTTCGAEIVTGTKACIIDGKHAAIIGSRTSHGGFIVEGSRSKA